MARLRVLADGSAAIEEVPGEFLDMLRSAKSIAECGDPGVEARFFPEPTSEPGEQGMRDDWKALVQPDLHEGFKAAREAMDADLRRAVDNGNGTHSIAIPARHLESWLGALNQARLALAEIHHLTDDDMRRQPQTPSDARDEAILLTGFYGMLQEWIVGILDR
jgi:hypothetical protein